MSLCEWTLCEVPVDLKKASDHWELELWVAARHAECSRTSAEAVCSQALSQPCRPLNVAQSLVSSSSRVQILILPSCVLTSLSQTLLPSPALCLSPHTSSMSRRDLTASVSGFVPHLKDHIGLKVGRGPRQSKGIHVTWKQKGGLFGERMNGGGWAGNKNRAHVHIRECHSDGCSVAQERACLACSEPWVWVPSLHTMTLWHTPRFQSWGSRQDGLYSGLCDTLSQRKVGQWDGPAGEGACCT